jgi:hypothetical protein
MYLDTLGLVTIGIGNLIDPLPAGLSMVSRISGWPATTAEIQAEWARVKNAKALIPLGWRAFQRICTLMVTEEALAGMVKHRMETNEAYLSRRYPSWGSWPAAAQLGTHSIAWAAGPGWVAPHFDAAAKAGDWQACAGVPGDANVNPECRGHAWLSDGMGPDVTGRPKNPGLRARNLANKLLFQFAPLGPDALPT